MKNLKKKANAVTAMILALSLFIIFGVGVQAEDAGVQGMDKSEITAGMTVKVVHYDVATGAYDAGTMTTKDVVNSNKHFVSLVKDSYAVNSDFAVSSGLKTKLNAITDAVNTVFEERKGKYSISRFGEIDSESYLCDVAISPYAVPILAEQNAGVDKSVWMVWGDGNGHVEEVWMTVAQDDEAKTTVSVKVVTPKKMSIRLQDGTILHNGDSFNVAIGEAVKFQMCSNNWDNDIYDDNGNGYAGTVVYSVTVSTSYSERSFDAASKSFVLPKGDRVLRTDVNRCFMAYRFHFAKGDYNKQTGVPNVVNTPLESLSVNLPLGSTVTAFAYKNMENIASADVFVENSTNLANSYTDYTWEY